MAGAEARRRRGVTGGWKMMPSVGAEASSVTARSVLWVLTAPSVVMATSEGTATSERCAWLSACSGAAESVTSCSPVPAAADFLVVRLRGVFAGTSVAPVLRALALGARAFVPVAFVLVALLPVDLVAALLVALPFFGLASPSAAGCESCESCELLRSSVVSGWA